MVSKGPKPIKVPDFTGKDADRAEAKLTALGLEVRRTEENHDTVDEGRRDHPVAQQRQLCGAATRSR